LNNTKLIGQLGDSLLVGVGELLGLEGVLGLEVGVLGCELL
jgi:hypothetical protein